MRANSAVGNYRVITKVANIPTEHQNKGYSPAVILIKDGKACKYIYQSEVGRKPYDLRPFDPIIKDIDTVDFVQEVASAESQIVHYDFRTDITKPYQNQRWLLYKYPIPILSK